MRCAACGERTSPTAGTILDRTRTPLTVWFTACWLFASQKDGISALSLKRQLEIGSYQTAWAMRVLRLTTEQAESWSKLGDQEIFVSDIVDQATVPDAKMTVGFARVAKGEALDISFPYDEVLILTKGSYTVRTEHDEAVTARAGEAIYLPAGSANSAHAEEDAEMVYVANPPAVYADHVAASAAGLDS
ncbi:MAG: hypothetical protein ACR2H2_08725 [Solirubrobacteraceae bacterium]